MANYTAKWDRKGGWTVNTDSEGRKPFEVETPLGRDASGKDVKRAAADTVHWHDGYTPNVSEIEVER